MDDLAFGRLVRLARIRKKWRQEDLGRAAGVSRTLVSRVERGHLGEISLAVIRRIAAPLDIRVSLLGRSRAVDTDRIINARHSALGEFVTGWVGGFDGWTVRAEVTYSVFGERGSIDLLCWHAASHSLLVIEIKTELLEFGSLLAKLDEKERLAPTIARRFGWQPDNVAVALLVGESMTNRRRASAHDALLRTVLPDDARALARWLRRPLGTVRVLRFVSDSRPGHVRTDFAGPTLVRLPGRPRHAA